MSCGNLFLSLTFVEDCSEKELLTVQFSGVAISNPDSASAWLKRRLLGKKVWLTLLDHTSQAALDQKAVQCLVTTRNMVHTVSPHVFMSLSN